MARLLRAEKREAEAEHQEYLKMFRIWAEEDAGPKAAKECKPMKAAPKAREKQPMKQKAATKATANKPMTQKAAMKATENKPMKQKAAMKAESNTKPMNRRQP